MISQKKHKDLWIFLATICSYLILYFSYNVKSYILAHLMYGLILFFLIKMSLIQTIFSMLIFTLPFEKGLRWWIFETIPKRIDLGILGYEFHFGISLKLIFLTTLALLLLMRRREKIQTGNNHKLLIYFSILASISTIVSANQVHSMLGLIRLLAGVLGLIISTIMFRKNENKKIFALIVLSSLIFLSFIGIRQGLSKSPINIFIEDTQYSRTFYTKAGEDLFRSSGTTGHPTFFGSYLSLIIPLSIGYSIKKLSKHKRRNLFILLLTITGVFATIATYSRSAWITLSVSLILMIKKHKKQQITPSQLVGFLLATILIATYVPQIISRVKSFENVWTVGTGKGRVDLILKSFEISKKYPIFGIGLNQFTTHLKSNYPSESSFKFTYPVHNTFLLFISELGIPAGTIFLVFSLTLLKSSYKKSKKSWLSWGVWVGCFTFFINAQFHPLFNQDPSFDMMMIMLGFLSSI
ncbi:O-antigen ligase family protein [Patescibacteria group bacterium]